MISVNPTSDELKDCQIVPEDVLKVYVPFDKKKYDKIKGTENCEYYLELLEKGFREASEFKDVPLNSLLSLSSEFRENGYKNMSGCIRKSDLRSTISKLS
jgi:hypothetical protein